MLSLHEMSSGIPSRAYRRRNLTSRFDSGTRSNLHRVDHRRICGSPEYETGRRVRQEGDHISARIQQFVSTIGICSDTNMSKRNRKISQICRSFI